MIKIGATLKLEALEEEETSSYRSKIVGQEGTTIYIDYPINEMTGRTNIFPKGTIFKVNLVDENQSVYQFITEITGKKTGNVPMLMIHFSQDEMVRIQRRKYVRVNSSLDVAIHDHEGLKEPFTTVTNDISGGGLCILLPIDGIYNIGDMVDICVVIPLENERIEYVHAEATVIRIFKKEDANISLLTVEYNNISENDRELIIRHCFEVQVKDRRQKF
ncbi:Flagellar brake protein YcgR [Paraliobacillus sp. PM-2]|uniref:flagellar brake protein n=1 Tax=Paraliobacillus sp. PM-2 TaxID=1462524 RepID=UPI00061C0EBF|nr:flagellar brake domain-containing protein [Paraliobacillus sp. PM-2]CQR46708.1 Flagellar brake protein YcgR [Paraliobacillus sp. PM-2]